MRATMREKARANREAAMPELKRIVKKFGRPAVTYCLGVMRERDKAALKIEKLKREVAQLERKL